MVWKIKFEIMFGVWLKRNVFSAIIAVIEL